MIGKEVAGVCVGPDQATSGLCAATGRIRVMMMVMRKMMVMMMVMVKMIVRLMI